MSHATARAHQVASIHGRAINESRRRAGLTPLSADELTSAFADVNLSPQRKAARPKFSSTGVADGMWAAIVAKLNGSVPASRTPIAAVRTSPASSAKPTQASADSMWAGIATGLNKQAGLATRARRAR